ncbi:MAG TPA: glycosyltransferase [Flavisolibacter sp.]|jgi:hypothetical protein|nr:glycosyltransferase [Flavisolibacter sp.]
MNNQIAILILFFNKLEQTIECIESFVPAKQPIYILNNGSNLKDWKTLKNKFDSYKQIFFFNSDKNLGACAGRNYLIEQTKEPWLLIIDNDITVKNKDDWYRLFLDHLNHNAGAKICCLKIFNKHEGQFVKPVNVVKNGNQVSVEASEGSLTNCFPCTGTIVHRSIFETYGLFDQNIFVGLEEYEFSLRAMTSNYGELKVFHLNTIELVHDHVYLTKKKDRLSVKVRYDENMLRKNAKVISERYNVVFNHNWEWWTRKQVATMTAGSLYSRVKTAVKKRLSW